MGILDKLIGAVNRAGEPLQNATTSVDPRLRRMDASVEQGAASHGTIVGIQRRHVGEESRTVFVVDVPDQAGEMTRFASEVTTTRHLHRLRLGLDVPVRVHKGTAAIDWPALASHWGLVGSEPGQRSHRKHPPEGIDDRDHTNATLKLLGRGRRASATIESLERVYVLGMPTVNWDVRLLLSDGSTVERRKEEVPPYAWWYTAPGAQVEIAVDELDASRVAVDWPALAIAAAPTVGLDDAPPAGSLAAQVEAESANTTPATATQMGVDTRELIAGARNVGHVNATLQSWVDELQAGRMKPKAFLKSVQEWEAAGLCTAAEAATARAAAGLEG